MSILRSICRTFSKMSTTTSKSPYFEGRRTRSRRIAGLSTKTTDTTPDAKGDKVKSKPAKKQDSSKTNSRKRQHVSVQYETDDSQVDTDKTKKTASVQKNPPSATRKSVSKEIASSKEDGKVSPSGDDWEPSQWREMLENIREIRKHKDAPVDSMGAEKIADEDAPPKVK